MTEKRFIFNGCSNTIEYDGKSILLDSYGEKIEDLLNEQETIITEQKEKIKELESEVGYYKSLLNSLKEEAKRISKIR